MTDLRDEYAQVHREQAKWQLTMANEGFQEMAADYAHRAEDAAKALESVPPTDALKIKQLQLEVEHFREMARYASSRFDTARKCLTGQM